MVGDVLSQVLEQAFNYLAGLAGDQSARPRNIDERIANLDVARDNLVAAVTAIDELKAEAEQNKTELSSALERLRSLEAQKASAEQELASLRQIASADIAVFQKLAGIPSRRDVIRERLVGFLLGLLASLAASLVWWLVTTYRGA
jgi:cell division protein ZapA (FtsZ GTPase activity inhibitor)